MVLCVFLRIWRKWLMMNNKKIGEHFISSNCYTCIELNAHALINLIIHFRENPNLTEDMFLPLLFSSQSCEKIFRATRSMTTTQSTVVNYSIKDILQRLDRIRSINNITHDLRAIIRFPREQKRFERVRSKGQNDAQIEAQSANNEVKDIENVFTDQYIENIVMDSLQEALAVTEKLGMQVENFSWNSTTIPKNSEEQSAVSDENESVIDDSQIAEESIFENQEEDIDDLRIGIDQTNEQTKPNSFLSSRFWILFSTFCKV